MGISDEELEKLARFASLLYNEKEKLVDIYTKITRIEWTLDQVKHRAIYRRIKEIAKSDEFNASLQHRLMFF